MQATAENQTVVTASGGFDRSTRGAQDDDEDGDQRGLYATLHDDAEQVEEENERLRNLLRAGRTRIGEFHAQLMLDNIRLTNEHDRVSTAIEEQRKMEEHLRTRLEFYFDDCRRLSADNDRIVEEARQRDIELKDSEHVVLQQRSVFKGAVRNVVRASDGRIEVERKLFKAREQLFATRARAVQQHRHMWELEDRITSTHAEREYLSLIDTSGGAGGVSMTGGGGHPDGTATTVTAKKGKEVVPLKPSTLLREEEDAEEGGLISPNFYRTTCSRADCVEVQREIARLRAKIESLGRAKYRGPSSEEGSRGEKANDNISTSANAERLTKPQPTSSLRASSKLKRSGRGKH